MKVPEFKRRMPMITNIEVYCKSIEIITIFMGKGVRQVNKKHLDLDSTQLHKISITEEFYCSDPGGGGGNGDYSPIFRK